MEFEKCQHYAKETGKLDSPIKWLQKIAIEKANESKTQKKKFRNFK